MKISDNTSILEQRNKDKDLLERLNVIAYEFDLESNRFIYVSRQAETILGYSREEWMKKGFWYDHVHPDDRAAASEFSRLHAKLKIDHEYEYRLISKNGSVLWFRDIAGVKCEYGRPASLQGVMVNITAQKETEKNLVQSEARYRALVEDQTEMITRWLPDGRFIFVNDVFCKFFGKRREELIGKTFVPDMPSEDIEKFKVFFTKLTAQNPIEQFTHRVFAKDGSIRWVRWTERAITDENGKIIEYQTVGRDITKRKLAEEALQKSEEHLSIIFENAPIGNIFADVNGNFLRVNKAICDILGYTKEELTKMNFRDITHPDYLQQSVEELEKNTFLKKSGYSFGKKYLKKDGTNVDALLHVNILYDLAQKPEYYIAQIIDISEKKRSEKKLRETELRLSSLFDNLHDVVFYESSSHGTFITENVFKMLGYTDKELSETNGLFFSLVHPDDAQKVKKAYQKWQKIEHNATSSLEVRLKRKDGGYIWVEDRMFAVITPERSYWAGFMIDITEKKRSETKLKETENRLSSILNNLSNIVFYENEEKLVLISENVHEMLGYRADEFYNSSNLYRSLVHPDDSEHVYKRINEWFEKGEEGSIISEFRIRKKDGSYIWVEDTMFTVVTGAKKYWTGFFIDVSDRKYAEEKLSETSKRLTTIVDNLTNLTVYETGGGKNFISENIEKLTGIPLKRFMDDIRLFGTLIHPEDAAKLDKRVGQWHKTGAKGVISSEFRLRKPDGSYSWIEDHMFKIKNDKDGEYLSGIMIDITETKIALEKMQESEVRLSTVLNNLPKIVIYQSGKNRDFISENITEMIGYTPEEILRQKYFFGTIMHCDDIKTVKSRLSSWKSTKHENPVLNMDYRLKKKDGDYIWIEDHMFEVQPEGQEPYLSGILIDVTERKQTEEKITQSLREKEILLKEIHHRVKNNLQVVSSLLKLQSSFLKDSSASNILLESQNRIRSMALVHQKLYQSKDFAQVDFSDYVQQLTMNLLNVYRYTGTSIQLNIKSDNIFIGIDVAIPCGLIINELVSNALKYAFEGKETGKIEIILNGTNKGRYKIAVADNGVGFPSNVDFRNTQSLGLQLVNTLVKQIDGKIELIRGNGSSFIISFDDTTGGKSQFPIDDDDLGI